MAERAEVSNTPEGQLEVSIVMIRGHRVILDETLAGLYNVETRTLIQAVKRNKERFPADFAFQLNKQEVTRLRSQTVISNGRGGRRYSPYAFTEQGVAMLSSVLRSKRAVRVNVEIMRASVQNRVRRDPRTDEPKNAQISAPYWLFAVGRRRDPLT